MDKPLKGKKLHFMRIFASEPDRWFTRKELAHLVGKRYLQRHDIQTLTWLEDNYWISANKERVRDGMLKRGMATELKQAGQSVGVMGMYYSYRLAGHVSENAFDEPTAAPAPEAGATWWSEAQQQMPSQVVYNSWIDRVKDKLGF